MTDLTTQIAAAQGVVDYLKSLLPPTVTAAKPAAPAASATPATPAAPAAPAPTLIFPASSPPALQGWKVVFHEEWKSIDPKVWINGLWYGDGHNDYNKNFDDASMVTLSNGRALISDRVSPDTKGTEGLPFKGGCLNTWNKVGFKPPFAIHANLQLTTLPYSWSSFYMQENSPPGVVGWEIDFGEMNSPKDDWLAIACHKKVIDPKTGQFYDYEYGVNPKLIKGLENYKNSDPHDYLFKIDAINCYVYIDGILVRTFPNPGIQYEMFIILANGIGGWTNPSVTDKNFAPPAPSAFSVGPITVAVPQ